MWRRNEDFVINTNQKCVHVNKNGEFENGKILYMEPDWTLKDFLQAASQRLIIQPTAFRVFTSDGVEIDDCMMIEDDDILFLSNGPNFSAPLYDGPVDRTKEGEIIPSIVGGYKIGKFLGRGGFGEVRVGVHQLTGEKVALKFLRKAEIMSIGAAERTTTEIQCLTALKHNNIIRLQQHIETPLHVVLVFELMEGGDLYNYMRKQGTTPAQISMSEDEARHVFQQVLSAVGYAHNQHICHRDLKLENILLKGKTPNYVKIADFGLSDFYRPGAMMRSSCGTLSFLPPEAFKGTSNAGPPLDVWALGVILFALLCGRLPFEGSDFLGSKRPRDAVIRARILKCQYKIDDVLSPEAKDLVRRMLKLDPTERASVPEIFNHCWLRTAAASTVDFMYKESTDSAASPALSLLAKEAKTSLVTASHNGTHSHNLTPLTVPAIAPVAVAAEEESKSSSQQRARRASPPVGSHDSHEEETYIKARASAVIARTPPEDCHTHDRTDRLYTDLHSSSSSNSNYHVISASESHSVDSTDAKNITSGNGSGDYMDGNTSHGTSSILSVTNNNYTSIESSPMSSGGGGIGYQNSISSILDKLEDLTSPAAPIQSPIFRLVPLRRMVTTQAPSDSPRDTGRISSHRSSEDLLSLITNSRPNTVSYNSTSNSFKRGVTEKDSSDDFMSKTYDSSTNTTTSKNTSFRGSGGMDYDMMQAMSKDVKEGVFRRTPSVINLNTSNNNNSTSNNTGNGNNNNTSKMMPDIMSPPHNHNNNSQLLGSSSTHPSTPPTSSNNTTPSSDRKRSSKQSALYLAGSSSLKSHRAGPSPTVIGTNSSSTSSGRDRDAFHRVASRGIGIAEDESGSGGNNVIEPAQSKPLYRNKSYAQIIQSPPPIMVTMTDSLPRKSVARGASTRSHSRDRKETLDEKWSGLDEKDS